MLVGKQVISRENLYKYFLEKEQDGFIDDASFYTEQYLTSKNSDGELFLIAFDECEKMYNFLSKNPTVKHYESSMKALIAVLNNNISHPSFEEANKEQHKALLEQVQKMQRAETPGPPSNSSPQQVFSHGGDQSQQNFTRNELENIQSLQEEIQKDYDNISRDDDKEQKLKVIASKVTRVLLALDNGLVRSIELEQLQIYLKVLNAADYNEQDYELLARVGRPAKDSATIHQEKGIEKFVYQVMDDQKQRTQDQSDRDTTPPHFKQEAATPLQTNKTNCEKSKTPQVLRANKGKIVGPSVGVVTAAAIAIPLVMKLAPNLNLGAKIGIIMGIAAVAAGLGLLLGHVYDKRQEQEQEQEHTLENIQKQLLALNPDEKLLPLEEMKSLNKDLQDYIAQTKKITQDDWNIINAAKLVAEDMCLWICEEEHCVLLSEVKSEMQHFHRSLTDEKHQSKLAVQANPFYDHDQDKLQSFEEAYPKDHWPDTEEARDSMQDLDTRTEQNLKNIKEAIGKMKPGTSINEPRSSMPYQASGLDLLD